MDRLVWLGRRYRALLVRESDLLDEMLAWACIGRAEDREYAALHDELVAIGRHQSVLARTLDAASKRSEKAASLPQM